MKAAMLGLASKARFVYSNYRNVPLVVTLSAKDPYDASEDDILVEGVRLLCNSKHHFDHGDAALREERVTVCGRGFFFFLEEHARNRYARQQGRIETRPPCRRAEKSR